MFERLQWTDGLIDKKISRSYSKNMADLIKCDPKKFIKW